MDEINPIEQPQPRAIITLTLNQNMTISVNFPNDEILCRFLLDKGTDAIKDTLRARSMPMIQPANGAGLPPGPVRRLHG